MDLLKKTVLTLLLISFWGISSSLAFEIPKHEGFVTDLGNILSPEEESQLEQSIQALQDETTAEIALLTVLTTDGTEIAQYATAVGQEWGVGKSDRDNGVMIVIAVMDRAYFIATGYGVEGALPDILTKQIGENNFPDNFRAGNYFFGIQGAITDIAGFLKEDPSILSKYNTAQNADSSEWVWEPLLVLGFIILAILKHWTGKKKDQKKKRSFLAASAFSGSLAVLLSFFMGLSLLLVFTTVFVFFVSLIIFLSKPGSSGGNGGFWGGGSSRGGGSGGGFGGFGGGSFGGGGSGGRW